MNRLLLIMLTLFALSGQAQQNNDKPYLTRKFPAEGITELAVETSGGSITVTGGGSSFEVAMYVKPNNNWNGKQELSSEEIEDRLKDFEIKIVAEGGRVVATARRKQEVKWDNKRNVSIGFVVTAPRNTATFLKTSGGSIQIASLTGEQNFATSGGSLKINDLKGKVQGKTSGGSIDASHCSDEIVLHTSGGSIKAETMKGKIELETSGGSITLHDLNGEIEAHTSGGSIKGDQIAGSLNTGTSGGSIRLAGVSGSLKASTSAGSIEAELTALGSYVNLASSAGSVRVTMPLDKGADLDLRGNRVSIPLKNFDGEAEKDRVRGKINGGGIPVTLTASSGSVYVNQ
ncbi:hypothetical protein [Dyadobacter sandarakinus]|nr:hypothetical protein [Dyadobacter sandarakinus]